MHEHVTAACHCGRRGAAEVVGLTGRCGAVVVAAVVERGVRALESGMRLLRAAEEVCIEKIGTRLA